MGSTGGAPSQREKPDWAAPLGFPTPCQPKARSWSVRAFHYQGK